MKLILLQLKRDLRTGAGLLALWWGLLAGGVIAARRVLGYDLSRLGLPDATWQLAETISTGWWIACLLAAWWILLDPPADETAFWRARPLRWQHLLAAKLLLIIGGLVLPMMLAQGVLLAAMDAAGWWSTVLMDMARTRLWWILGAALLAALGGTWRRMVSITFSCWVAGAAAYVLLDGLSKWGILGFRGVGVRNLMFSIEALVLSAWLPLVVVTSLIFHYAFRRSAWTLSLVLTLSVGWILLHPAQVLGEPEMPFTGETLPDFGVGIHQDQQLWRKNTEGGLDAVVAMLDLEPPPPPYLVRPLWLSESRVIFSNRTVRTSGGVEPWMDDDPLSLAMYQSAVPGLTLLNTNPMHDPGQPFVTLADYSAMSVTVVERSLFGGQSSKRTGPRPEDFAGQEGAFQADLMFRVYRHQPVTELGLEPGTPWRDGPNRIVVLGSNPSIGDVTAVTLRLQWLKLENTRSLDPVHCILVNRERGEALVPTRTNSIRWQQIYPFAIEDIRVSYAHRGDGDTLSPIDPDWLADASVLVVTRPVVGEVAKEMRLDHFRLWPNPGELLPTEGN